MASVAEWVEGARPRTLPAAIAPVVAGLGVTGYTGTDLSAMHVAVAALLALLVALALQIGVNCFNDYSDGSAAPTASGSARSGSWDRVWPRLPGQASSPAEPGDRGCSGDRPGAGQPAVDPATHRVAAVLAAYGYTGGKHPYGYLGLGTCSSSSSSDQSLCAEPPW